MNLPVAGSPLWRPGFRVRYAVAYEYADGTVVRSGWWAGGDGYVGSTAYAMPVLNIPCDRTGQVVARRMIRQIHGLPERVLARLANNSETMWRDPDSGAVDMPPPPSPTINCWSMYLPVAGSPLWQPGFRVRYAVAYEYADGTVVRSAWWRTEEPQDDQHYTTSPVYAFPVLDLPGDPTGQIVARQIIRQFRGLPERVVARLTDNGARAWGEKDRGGADMPEAYPEGLGVTLYSEADFRGQSQLLGPGRYDIGQLAIGNDALSSLRVPPCWRVTLYEHGGFGGGTLVLTGDTSYVGDAWNDRASSIVVEQGVLLYSDAYFQGQSQFLGAGRYDIDQLATRDTGYVGDAWNDQASSIAVEPPSRLDVAAGKPASASSEWSAEHTASHANPVVPPGSGGWSPRGEPEEHWWQVDLGRPYQLSRIELVTRQENDQPVTRRNFALWASNDPDMRERAIVGLQGDATLPFQATFTAPLRSDTRYRYVRAVKTVPEYFFIGELRVFAVNV